MKAKTIFIIMICAQILSGQETFLNFETAKLQAKEQDKHVLMVFSGSDWCKPCIQLKKDILESVPFQENQEVVLLYVDFPYKKQNKLSKEHQSHNERLAENYNQEGSFPKVILFNAEGEALRTIDYSQSMTPNYFLDQLALNQ